jgi:hypothetical protein
MFVSFQPSPTTGNGVHFWLLSQANRCRLGGLELETTAQCLRDAVRNCGRVVPEREIVDAVQKAFASDWVPDGAMKIIRTGAALLKRERMPAVDPALIASVEASGLGAADLSGASPVPLTDPQMHPEAIIDTLFPGDPLLAVGKFTAEDARTAPRSHWRGHLEWSALIVPSPMSALTGTNLDGEESRRCLDNTGPRRFLVVEFDSGATDGHAARLLHLATFAPLIVVVHSGCKSLHGWFFVANQPEAKVRQFFRYARALGADKATWSPCQMVRIPGGLRDDGHRQAVLYLNLQPLQSHVPATRPDR